MSDAASPAVPNEERLFSLVLALLATETGLTKAEVLSTVQGYRQRYRRGGDNASLERQFERDKDDVRDLGVPLETIESDLDPNGQRYRIPKGAYDLPADVRFTPQEVALLNLASVVWREGSLSGDSRRAILKLRSLGVGADEPLLGFAPRIRATAPAFGPLSTAVERHQVVRFEYLKPGEAAARRRTVEPLALVQFGGRWHLHGTDVDQAGLRTFLLTRIVGRVQLLPRRFSPPEGDHASVAVAALRQVANGNRARVRTVPGTDADTRLQVRGRRTEDGALELHYPDLALIADELAAFGPEVLVESPPALRAAVRDRLLAVARAHAAEAADPEPGARTPPGGGDHD